MLYCAMRTWIAVGVCVEIMRASCSTERNFNVANTKRKKSICSVSIHIILLKQNFYINLCLKITLSTKRVNYVLLSKECKISENVDG